MNRRAFYDHIRKPLFGGKIQKSQVEGMERILDAWEQKYRDKTSLPQFAYCLATAYWETAQTMQPIKEYGNNAYFTKLYDVQGQNPKRARDHGNTQPGDGAKYCGRGLVQTTWKNNYLRAQNELKKLGIEVDLVNHPDLALKPEVAIPLLFEGMEAGWYTGLNLDNAVDDEVDGDEFKDFVKARKIINGTDKAEQIGRIAETFLAALEAAS